MGPHYEGTSCTLLLTEDDEDEFADETLLEDEVDPFLELDPDPLFGNPLTPLYLAWLAQESHCCVVPPSRLKWKKILQLAKKRYTRL